MKLCSSDDEVEKWKSGKVEKVQVAACGNWAAIRRVGFSGGFRL
jgi:hypothetical protein